MPKSEKIIDILQTEDTYIDMDKIIVKMKNVILFCPLFFKISSFFPLYLGWIVLVYIWT